MRNYLKVIRRIIKLMLLLFFINLIFLFIRTLITKFHPLLRNEYKSQQYEKLKSFGYLSPSPTVKTFDKVLVSYVMYSPFNSTDTVHKICSSNFNFFLDHGIVDDQTIHYMFHLIGNTPISSRLKYLSQNQQNIEILAGIDYKVDLYAHGDAIKMKLSSYDLFIFLNCGSRGPYYPLAAITGPMQPTLVWLQPFIEKFEGDNIKVVGPTISCEVSRHVQSYTITMDQDAARVAYDFWSEPQNASKLDIIDKSEVGLTTKFLELGYGIASLDSRHIGRNFLNEDTSCDPEYDHLRSSFYANPVSCRYDAKHKLSDLVGCYGQEPCEVVFVKNGGDVARMNYFPSSTKVNLDYEDQHIYDDTYPHLCIHAVFPYRPYLPLASYSMEVFKEYEDIMRSSTNIVYVYLTSKNIYTWLHDMKQQTSLSTSLIIAEGTIILLGVEDMTIKLILDHEMHILNDQYQYIPIIILLPDDVYHQYHAYTKKLCVEQQKHDVIISPSLSSAVVSCEDMLSVSGSPIQYLMTDIVMQYFKTSSCAGCVITFIQDYDTYTSYVTSHVSSRLRTSSEILEYDGDVIAYSLSSHYLSSTYMKDISYAQLLPRRPTIADYERASEQFIRQIQHD